VRGKKGKEGGGNSDWRELTVMHPIASTTSQKSPERVCRRDKGNVKERSCSQKSATLRQDLEEIKGSGRLRKGRGAVAGGMRTKGKVREGPGLGGLHDGRDRIFMKKHLSTIGREERKHGYLTSDGSKGGDLVGRKKLLRKKESGEREKNNNRGS